MGANDTTDFADTYPMPRGDLLDRVADSDVERREVRRILSCGADDGGIDLRYARARVSEADLDLQAERAASWRNAFPACSGDCGQGDRLCTTPGSCRGEDGIGAFRALALIVATYAVIAALWAFFQT